MSGNSAINQDKDHQFVPKTKPATAKGSAQGAAKDTSRAEQKKKQQIAQTTMQPPSKSASRLDKRARAKDASKSSPVPADDESPIGETRPAARPSRATEQLPSDRRAQQSSDATEEELESAETLASQSAAGPSRAGDTSADNDVEEKEDASQEIDENDSEGWEDFEDEALEGTVIDEEANNEGASAQPGSSTIPQSDAASDAPNPQPDAAADGEKKKKKEKKEDKLVPIPIDRVWSKETLQGKGNRRSFRHWLTQTGRDPTLAQYQVKAQELTAIIHKLMKKDQKERDRKEKRKIAEGKLKEKESEKARSGKRDRDNDSDTDPKARPKKKKRVVLDSSPDSSAQEEVGAGDATEGEALGLAHEVEEYVPEPEEEAGDDPEMPDQEELTIDGDDDDVLDDLNPQQMAKYDEVRKNLETIRLAALDSLQLLKSYKDQIGGAEQESGVTQAPKHYALYEQHNPQLILQGDDEKPIFGYDTQICVRKIIRARAGVVQRMHDKKRSRNSPYLVKLTELKGYCREIKTPISNVLKEKLPVDHKDVATKIINDLFLQGLNDPKKGI